MADAERAGLAVQWVRDAKGVSPFCTADIKRLSFTFISISFASGLA